MNLPFVPTVEALPAAVPSVLLNTAVLVRSFSERVGGLAGRIHIAGEHLTQCGEAGLAGRRAPQHGLDLRILGQEVELERVGAVVDERRPS